MSTLINVEDVMRLAFTAEEGCRGHVVSELDIYVAECRYLVPVIGRALYNKLLEGEYGELLEGYVAPALAAWVRYIVEPFLAARCWDGHLPATGASLVEIERVVMQCRKRIAEALTRRLVRHIDEVEYVEYNIEDSSLNRCSIDGGIVQIR
jgi:hypothetical protein